MDIHVEKMPEGYQIEAEARDLGAIKDLPGGTSIWHGYVSAVSPEEARQKVKEAY